MLKDDTAYNYRGARSFEKLADFSVKEGYLQSEAEHVEKIPRRLEGMERFQKETKSFLKQASRGIDELFIKIRLSFIPEVVRYMIVGLLVISPCFAVCWMIFLDDDEE